MRLNRLALYAWGVLAYNILVVLWGAFVRATGSGAGCGSHWPTCHGEVIPLAPQTETLIEFTHRLTSGLALLAVIWLFFWTFRAYPKRHVVRTGATLSLIFIVIEAVIADCPFPNSPTRISPLVCRYDWAVSHLIGQRFQRAASSQDDPSPGQDCYGNIPGPICVWRAKRRLSGSHLDAACSPAAGGFNSGCLVVVYGCSPSQ